MDTDVSSQLSKWVSEAIAASSGMRKMRAMTEEAFDPIKIAQAARLKAARKRLFATAKLFAEIVGEPYTTYAHYEAGRRTITAEVAQRYAAKLEVSAAHILLGSDDQSVGQPPLPVESTPNIFGMPIQPASDAEGLAALAKEMSFLIKGGHYAKAAVYADLLSARLRLAEMARQA